MSVEENAHNAMKDAVSLGRRRVWEMNAVMPPNRIAHSTEIPSRKCVFLKDGREKLHRENAWSPSSKQTATVIFAPRLIAAQLYATSEMIPPEMRRAAAMLNMTGTGLRPVRFSC